MSAAQAPCTPDTYLNILYLVVIEPQCLQLRHPVLQTLTSIFCILLSLSHNVCSSGTLYSRHLPQYSVSCCHWATMSAAQAPCTPDTYLNILYLVVIEPQCLQLRHPVLQTLTSIFCILLSLSHNVCSSGTLYSRHLPQYSVSCCHWATMSAAQTPCTPDTYLNILYLVVIEPQCLQLRHPVLQTLTSIFCILLSLSHNVCSSGTLYSRHLPQYPVSCCHWATMSAAQAPCTPDTYLNILYLVVIEPQCLQLRHPVIQTLTSIFCILLSLSHNVCSSGTLYSRHLPQYSVSCCHWATMSAAQAPCTPDTYLNILYLVVIEPQCLQLRHPVLQTLTSIFCILLSLSHNVCSSGTLYSRHLPQYSVSCCHWATMSAAQAPCTPDTYLNILYLVVIEPQCLQLRHTLQMLNLLNFVAVEKQLSQPTTILKTLDTLKWKHELTWKHLGPVSM